MCCYTFVRYVIKIKRTLLSSYIKNCKKSSMNKPSTIKNTIFSFFLSSLFISFSNIGCRIYKNNTPPIPNLILGDKAILPWKLIAYSVYVCHGQEPVNHSHRYDVNSSNNVATNPLSKNTKGIIRSCFDAGLFLISGLTQKINNKAPNPYTGQYGPNSTPLSQHPHL